MGRWWNNRKKRWANWGTLVGLLVPNYRWGLRFRGRWVQWTLKSHGKGLKISSMVNIYNPSRVSVGDNVYIGHGTYIGDGDITIDDTGYEHLKITNNGVIQFKDSSTVYGSLDGTTWTLGNTSNSHMTLTTSGLTISATSTVFSKVDSAGNATTQQIPFEFTHDISDPITTLTVASSNSNKAVAKLDNTVTLTKPFTSRPANSEKYLVCQGFKGITPLLLKKLHIIMQILFSYTIIYLC